jgi:hypothetical protein
MCAASHVPGSRVMANSVFADGDARDRNRREALSLAGDEKMNRCNTRVC